MPAAKPARDTATRMRIIAGAWRGRPLQAPAGDATRPTADRVREALFSMLASRLGSFEGLTVLDGFAGTGALGLEALSRGAARVVFVEQAGAAVTALKANIAALGAGARAQVLALPMDRLPCATTPCDLVLLDPPYGQGLAEPALATLAAQGWLAPHALISVETGRYETLAIAHDVLATRDHGKARLHLLRAAG